MFKYHLKNKIHHKFNHHNTHYPSYNTIINNNKNNYILHYTKNKCKIHNNNLILINTNYKYKNYTNNITHTFPINNKFTQTQHKIYNIILKSLKTNLHLYHPKTSILKITNKIIHIIINNLIKLNILKNNINKLITQNTHHPFFIHNLNH